MTLKAIFRRRDHLALLFHDEVQMALLGACTLAEPVCAQTRETARGAKLLALEIIKLQPRGFVGVCTLAELRVCSAAV